MAPKAACCSAEAVKVSVYVEKLPQRSSPSRRRHHHHHLYRRLHLSDRPSYYRRGHGYDRKAELLLYSRHLREAARSQFTASTPTRHPASATNDPERVIKIVSAQRKQPLTCFGDWKRVLVPSSLRSYLAGFKGRKDGNRRKKKKQSGSTTDKMNAIVRTPEMKKKCGFVSKLVSSIQKRSFNGGQEPQEPQKVSSNLEPQEPQKVSSNLEPQERLIGEVIIPVRTLTRWLLSPAITISPNIYGSRT